MGWWKVEIAGWGAIYCVTGFSGRRGLARGAAHGRRAVGAGALPHGESARHLQLQLLEEGGPYDLCRLGALAGAPRQHAVHHTQLHTEKTYNVTIILPLISSVINA